MLNFLDSLGELASWTILWGLNICSTMEIWLTGHFQNWRIEHGRQQCGEQREFCPYSYKQPNRRDVSTLKFNYLFLWLPTYSFVCSCKMQGQIFHGCKGAIIGKGKLLRNFCRRSTVMVFAPLVLIHCKYERKKHHNNVL